MFTGTEWLQIIMNGGVMPGLVIVLFKTLTDNHKKEIENHILDKQLLQKEISKQSDIAIQQSNVLRNVSTILEKINMRLDSLESIVKQK